MVYLRTASGAFLNAENIVGLAPQHGGDGKIVGWNAVRADGSTTPLARFYGAPGRVEKALPHLFPAPAPAAALGRRVIVPYTNKAVRLSRVPTESGHPSP